MKFLMKGYMLPDATQKAEIGGSLEVKFVLGSTQLLTGNPMCSESLNEVPVGRCVAIWPPGGRVQVAQLPQKAPQSARRLGVSIQLSHSTGSLSLSSVYRLTSHHSHSIRFSASKGQKPSVQTRVNLCKSGTVKRQGCRTV